MDLQPLTLHLKGLNQRLGWLQTWPLKDGFIYLSEKNKTKQQDDSTQWDIQMSFSAFLQQSQVDFCLFVCFVLFNFAAALKVYVPT